MSLFGSSGIRGIINERITPDLLLRIGNAVSIDCGQVVLGKDTRCTGDMVMSALMAGLTSNGTDCHVAGLVPTPTLARAARLFDAGLMITASHNPPEYNGVKMWNPDGSAFGECQMGKIETRVMEDAVTHTGWERIGGIHSYEGAVDLHIEEIMRSLPSADISVVIDCGNGAASGVTPLILRRMGCEVTSLNSHADGHFPGRPSEPTEKNLSDLKEMVLKKGAELGIAHDGDGDRMVAIDEKGRFVGGDSLLSLFAARFSDGDIAAPINASMVLEEIVKGDVIRTKVGDVHVSEAMRDRKIKFGGEPSGTFIFSDQTLCPDGIFAAALLAVMVSERSLSEIVGGLPSYPIRSHAISFNESRRVDISDCIQKAMDSVECERVSTLDGFRADFEEGWFLIRVSGTEPKIRITSEAREEKDADRMMERAMDIARGCL